MAATCGILTELCLVAGLLMTIIAVGLPNWERTDRDATINDSIYQHAGLWLKCTSYLTGNWECDDYNTFFLALPTKLQAARGLGVAALFFGAAASFFFCFAITNDACHISFYTMKRIRFLSGFFAIIAALCILIAASWYARDLHLDYEYQRMRRISTGRDNSSTFVFGPALFVAWCGGVLLLLGAILSMYMGCEKDEEHPPAYVYKPEMNTISGSRVEYV